VRRILDRIAYHAVYDDSIVDALRYARANGFAGVQAAVEAPHLSFEGLTDVQCAEIASCRSEQNCFISLHAPDDTASLFTTSRHLADGVFNYFRALFRFAEKVGASLITVHLGALTRFRTDEDPARTMPEADQLLYEQALRENLRRLITLGRGRCALCVEYWDVDTMVEAALQPHLEAGELSLCWDLAKTFDKQMNRNAALERYMWDHVAHIRQVHLHDIRDGATHQVIGTGGIDFAEFLPHLAAANVMSYVIEVRPREKAVEGLAALVRS
jgi:sugar phosphate isomerase/epimerase